MKQILYKLFEHQYLGRDEARTILQNIAQGKYNDVQVASLITVFLMRNISVEELCGFRDALLEMRIPVDLMFYDKCLQSIYLPSHPAKYPAMSLAFLSSC